MTTTVDTTDLRQQIAGRQPRAGKSVKQAVQEQLPQIARALPKATGMTPERFTRLVMTEVSRNPKLQECSVESFLGAMMYSAQLGVEPGPLGHAYLVPFGNNVTFILGYKGILALARRSGEIKSIEARAVHEHDEFDWSYGLEDNLVHRPALDDRGAPIRYYGICRFKDGGHYFLVMSKQEVEKRRDRSKAKDSGPWKTDYEAMALKTVVRAMQPYLPLTSEAATAIEVDERVTATFDPDAEQPLQIMETPYEDVPAEGQPSALESGALDAGPVVEHPPAEAAGPVSDNPLVVTVDEFIEANDIPQPEEALGVDAYDGWTADELAAQCMFHGLPNTGSKKTLIARLREHDVRPT